ACDFDGDIMAEMRNQKLSLSHESTSRWVISHGRMLMLSDAQKDERHYPLEVLPTIGSELVLLLQAANEILGVLVVQSKGKDAFSLDDVDVMQSIADQLAIAIYNA